MYGMYSYDVRWSLDPSFLQFLGPKAGFLVCLARCRQSFIVAFHFPYSRDLLDILVFKSRIDGIFLGPTDVF